tara:strand:- start:110 stop:283 length:174 start_codon:yes stop_codon:yes gene_type:complete
MGGKYSTDPVKRDDPSLGTDGGSPYREYKRPKKYIQLSLPIRLAKLKKGSNNNVNAT